MQKLYRYCVVVMALCAVFITTSFAYAEEKSEEALIQESMTLSGAVKEFEKKLGIKPTEALSKSSNEQQPVTILRVWMQKKNTLAIYNAIDALVSLSFHGDKIPNSRIDASRDYSFYWRKTEMFAGQQSVITPNFAKRTRVEQVHRILHEDLHGAIKKNDADDESIVTALGYFATLEFFQEKKDNNGIVEARHLIEDSRAYAKELLTLTRQINDLFSSVGARDERRNQALEILSESFHLSWLLAQDNQSPKDALEALISHELMYWKHFNRLADLYEKNGNFTILLNELKSAPENTREFFHYLNTLEKKYESPAY